MSDDGFKPGTNYNHRMKGRADPGRMVAAALAQDEACALGHHDEAVARPGYVTRIRGEVLKPGTAYCLRCGALGGVAGCTG